MFFFNLLVRYRGKLRNGRQKLISIFLGTLRDTFFRKFNPAGTPIHSFTHLQPFQNNPHNQQDWKMPTEVILGLLGSQILSFCEGCFSL